MKPRLELFTNQAVSTIACRTVREREIEGYYSQKVQLLEEECSYLRR
jgi:hypothetical protein